MDATLIKPNGRHIKFSPAFDRPDAGIHGVEIEFALVQDRYAVVFVIFTQWMLPHIETNHRLCQAKGAYVRLHIPEPHYHNQEVGVVECYYTGGNCYSDVTYTGADPVFDRLVAEGDDGVWAALQDWLNEMRMDVVAVKGGTHALS